MKNGPVSRWILDHFCCIIVLGKKAPIVLDRRVTGVICPYCKSNIPDNSEECFVCGEDLRPKAISEYYTDMDSVKKEDENLYKKISKEMGTDDDALTRGQKIAIGVTAVIAFILLMISLDGFRFIQYKAGSAYEKKQAVIVGLHYIGVDRNLDNDITTDCIVEYEYNGEVRQDEVKAGFHYELDDVITVYTDLDGKPYHFCFSLGDLLQLIIIASFTALTVIAIVRWHRGPNADGHLDVRMPGYTMGRRFRAPKSDKWWRYF